MYPNACFKAVSAEVIIYHPIFKGNITWGWFTFPFPRLTFHFKCIGHGRHSSFFFPANQYKFANVFSSDSKWKMQHQNVNLDRSKEILIVHYINLYCNKSKIYLHSSAKFS